MFAARAFDGLERRHFKHLECDLFDAAILTEAQMKPVAVALHDVATTEREVLDDVAFVGIDLFAQLDLWT